MPRSLHSSGVIASWLWMVGLRSIGTIRSTTNGHLHAGVFAQLDQHVSVFARAVLSSFLSFLVFWFSLERKGQGENGRGSQVCTRRDA